MFKKLQLLVAALVFITLSASAQWMNTPMPSTTNNADQAEKKQNFHDIQKIFNDYWKDKSPSEDEQANAPFGGYQQFKRWEWFMEPRTYPTGEFFDPEILINEYKKQKETQQRLSVHPATTAANWTFIGPAVVPSSGGGAGRINAVRIDPTDANIIFACTANGGLWKSLNGGTSWLTPGTDLLPALGVSDVAVNPNYHDSIFIGTGDRDGYEVGGDFWGGTYSAGVMVSGDGGLTWNTTGLSYVQTQSNIVHRVLINPNNTDILLAATRTGVYRSVNAGATWTLVRSGNILDMEFRPGDANTVYACTSTILYRSSDLGATWSTASSSLGGGGGAVIAVTPANPLVVYSINGSFVVKKSTDGGTTFTTVGDPTTVINNQGFYDCAIAVSPINENTVVIAGSTGISGGSGIAKSIDGGSTWTGIGSTHVDHHDLLFAPNGTTLYNTNDGGIYKSVNTGSSWNNISSGIAAKQYYRLATSAITPYYMYAGAQDNGTDQLKAGLWKHVGSGCDGMDCAQDWADDNLSFISCQNGAFYRSTNGGTSFSQLTMPATGDWTSPIVFDPVTHTTVYVGLSDLYKTTNSGTSWTVISSGQLGGNQIRVAVAPTNVNIIYSASISKISRTDNGGTTWTNISSGVPLSTTGLTGIAVSSLNPMKVWITVSGYVAGTKVYYSSNGGASWTNISGSLPNVPADCIVYQDNSQDAVYAGTDFGVYYRDATMSDWIPFMTGLPNVMVDDLEIQYGTINKIRAATYGRGLWESDLNTSSLFTLDAGVLDITTPTSAQVFCDSTFGPVVLIRNFGQATLDSLNINYQVDAGPILVYHWTGSLAPSTSATVSLPVMSASPGTHSFTVFTSDPNGGLDENSFNDTRTTTLNIISNLLVIPVVEGFEAATFPPPSWTITDPSAFISRFTTAGGFGNTTFSLKAKCYTAASVYAYVKTPEVNFSSLIAPAKMTFSLAYAMRATTSDDSMKVFVSTDCGVTFTEVYSKTGTALATTAIHAVNFTPIATDWRTDSIDLTSYIGQSHIQFQFEFYGDHGNNIYVDDINIIDGSVGIHELNSESKISVYPNPTSGEVTFNFNTLLKEKVTIEIFDVVGNKVAEMNSLKTTNGTNMVVDLGKQSSGMYFYRIVNASGIINQGKIVKM